MSYTGNSQSQDYVELLFETTVQNARGLRQNLHFRRKTRGKSRNKDEEGKEPTERCIFKAGLARHGGGHLSLIPVFERQGQMDLCESEDSLVYTVSSRRARTV